MNPYPKQKMISFTKAIPDPVQQMKTGFILQNQDRILYTKCTTKSRPNQERILHLESRLNPVSQLRTWCWIHPSKIRYVLSQSQFAENLVSIIVTLNCEDGVEEMRPRTRGVHSCIEYVLCRTMEETANERWIIDAFIFVPRDDWECKWVTVSVLFQARWFQECGFHAHSQDGRLIHEPWAGTIQN